MTSGSTAHGAGCACCAGVTQRTPALIDNRPGLDAIAYRIGAHGDFMASMRARLSSEAFPALRALLTRDPSDFSLALLDAFASAADVLTFYQERIANEAYLRTSIERRSLVELARLIDYRLKPGVAAEAYLAFSLDETPGAPTRLDLDSGIRVQSEPGPGEQPQLFQTIEPVEARLEWNAMPAATFDPHLPFSTDCYLEGIDLNLKPGDALLFVGEEAEANIARDNWDVRFLDAVELDPERNLTHVRWRDPLGSAFPPAAPARQPQVHVFRRRAAVFGHNAPDPTFLGALRGTDQWDFRISPVANSVDLDTVVQQLAPGSWLALSKPRYLELFRVTEVSELSRADYAVSGKVTRARLAGENYELFDDQVRETTVFAVNEQLRFAGRPVTAPVFGTAVALALESPDLAPARAIALSGKRAHWRVTASGEAMSLATAEASRRLRLGELLEVLEPPRQTAAGKLVPATSAEVATTTLRWRVRDAGGVTGDVEAGPGDLAQASPPRTAEAVAELVFIDDALDAIAITPGRTRLTLAAPLQHCYDPSTLRVNANVALATHGDAVLQVLGSGDARRSHQRFELRSLPLTFTTADSELGAASSLHVRVNDVEWAERRSFFDAGPDDRGFTLRIDDDGKARIQFGDGEHGSRLPTGRDNVLASYRRGIGAGGNVGAGRLSQLMTRPLGLKGVTNPAPAAGGADPDDAASARRTMPLGVRTLGRAVSIRDYEDFARAFTGIAKARAAVLNLRAGRTVVVTVAGADGVTFAPGHPTLTRLVNALRASGDPLVRFEVLPHREAHFRLELRVKLDPARVPETVLRAVETALRDAFSFEARDFGQGVARSEVIAVVDGVPGVVAVDVDRFYRGTKRRLDTRLAADPPRIDAAGSPLAAELLTLAPGPLDSLGEMP